MRFALGSVVLAAVVLAASACGNSHSTGGSGNSSSRLILGGKVKCTATVTTPVQIGHELGVSVSLQNVSKDTVNVLPAYGGVWALVKSPDGTTYDTRVPLENTSGPPPAPIPLKAGETKTTTLDDLRVRWEGPLRVTPGCDVSGAPPVRVAVTSPGLPASETAAVNAVVAATGHLLDKCRPRTSGVSVAGRIDPPSGNAPPLQARCSIDLQRRQGFYNAQVLVVTPPDLSGVHVDAPYEGLTAPFRRNENTQAIGWQFVVTRDGATSVNSAQTDTTRSGQRGFIPAWTWTGTTWEPADGVRCGGSDGGSGGVNGPDVRFVSFCGP
ncbi:MAG TPA: hypothetical protein VGH79_04950 [Gaiellaceae bacterium]|jgi:hypothetical protein